MCVGLNQQQAVNAGQYIGRETTSQLNGTDESTMSHAVGVCATLI